MLLARGNPPRKGAYTRRATVGAAAAAPIEPGCGLHLQPGRKTARNPSRMNTYANCAANPCRMRTYKIVELNGLKVSWNEHLQKMGGRGGLLLPKALFPRREN